MSKEKKVAVYLSIMDWQVVIACILSHANQRPPVNDVLRDAGRNRAMYIVGEISSRLPVADSLIG